MKRFSAREFALLCLPVAAVAGVGFWAARRPAPLEPHIEACYLRPATEWEVFLGADMGFTARAVKPSDAKGIMIVEIANEKGQMWNSWFGSWEKFARPGTGMSSGATLGPRDVQELSNGLDAHQIFDDGPTLTARVSWVNPKGVPLNAIASATVIASKTYVLRSSDALRTSASKRPNPNFKVIGATLGPQKFDNGAFMKNRFIRVEIQMLDGSAVENTHTTGDWELYINGKRNLYLSLFRSENEIATLKGTTIIPMKGREDADYSDGVGVFCEARGLLSINDGWPLEVALQLPNGVNAQNVEQKFIVKTRLAPKPKKSP